MMNQSCPSLVQIAVRLVIEVPTPLLASNPITNCDSSTCSVLQCVLIASDEIEQSQSQQRPRGSRRRSAHLCRSGYLGVWVFRSRDGGSDDEPTGTAIGCDRSDISIHTSPHPNLTERAVWASLICDQYTGRKLLPSLPIDHGSALGLAALRLRDIEIVSSSQQSLLLSASSPHLSEIWWSQRASRRGTCSTRCWRATTKSFWRSEPRLPHRQIRLANHKQRLKAQSQ